MRAIAIAALTLLGGCRSPLVVLCDSDVGCLRDGKRGICIASGVSGRYCAFVAPECAGGYRFDATAGDGLAGTCATAPTRDAGTDLATGVDQRGDDLAPPPDLASTDLSLSPSWRQEKSGTFTWLFAVWGSGPGDVWAVGQGGEARRSTDRGATWATLKTPNQNALNGIWGSGPKDVWVVGDTATVLRTADSGVSWASHAINSAIDLQSVSGAGGEVWVVGDGGTIFHHDGKVWTKALSPTTAQLNGVFAVSTSDVWIVGVGGTILRSQKQGPFAPLVQAMLPKGTFTSVWANADEAYVCSEEGAILRFKNGLYVEKADTQAGLQSIAATSAKDLLAVGFISNQVPSAILRSRDGSNWPIENVGMIFQELNGVWGSGPDDVYAVGHNGTILHWR